MTVNIIFIIISVTSCLISLSFLLYGLIVEGPAFYNGQECSMTYSQYQFLPIRAVKSKDRERYRLLKFTDGRDPRHQHLYDISGSYVENFGTQNKKRLETDAGRLLEFNDNWCLLPKNMTKAKQWNEAPYPHRGHPVLYVPGHWGSFSQARSIGAHGTRWTGRSLQGKSLYNIYDSFKSGQGMHDGRNLFHAKTEDQIIDWYHSSYSLSYTKDFVMDVFSLDFNSEGAALHSSKLLRQAEFFARAIETIAKGCQLEDSGITIVAHSIGAWVVRIALKMYPHLTEKGWVLNVITLASPLRGVPYAVDGGVHDIARHLNDLGDIDNVTFISVSGGIRDEMIPPEACEVSLDANKTTSSKTFLATTIMNRNVGNTKYKYGMDHRAIVWCYDLLKVVREMIFALVITTDQGMTPYNRLIVAHKIMLGKHVDNQSTFQKNDTEQLRESLLSEVGYAKAIAIQLASPYHLNSLLKLAILALLVDLHLLALMKKYTPRKQFKLYSTKLIDATGILMIVPMLLLALFCIRRAVTCHGHECQLLLGTVYILSQVATLIYIIICQVTSLVAGLCSKLGMQADSPQSTTEKNKFSTIVLKYFKKQLQHLLFMFPLVIGSRYVWNYAFMSDNGVLVWNKTSIAAYEYCFVSVFALQLLFLIKSLIILSDWWSQIECKVTLIFTLAIIKATHGTILYALSSTNGDHTDSDLYNEFFTMTKSNIGLVVGYRNELVLCTLTKVMPTFIAINAVRAYAAVRLQFNSICDNNQTLSIKDTPETNRSGGYWILSVAKVSLTIWYAWNVFASQSQDDQLIPAYAAITFFSYYWKSIPISSEALDIYSAVARNDLSLCCSVAKDQYKKE